MYCTITGSLGIDDAKPTIPASSERSASKRGVTPKNKKIENEPVRRSSRVTIEKLQDEVNLLKASNTDGSNDLAIEEKQALLDTMKAQKQSTTYEAYLTETYSSEPRNRLPREPYSALTPLNLPEDADEAWPEAVLLELSDIATTKQPTTQTTKKQKTSKHSSIPTTTPTHEYIEHTEYIKQLKSLSITEDGVAKLTESRISSVWIHPSEHKLIVAAGDKAGHLGLWDVDSKTTGVDGVFKYRPHVEV